MELIVAIGIISVGLFAVWSLFLSNFSGEQEARMRIIGANLAREGVETVKNIRDSNWLHLDANDPCFYDGVEFDPCLWDSGLTTENNIILNLLSADRYLGEGTDGRLYLDGDGIYVHDPVGNTKTNFSRLITINSICCVDTNGGGDLLCDDYTDDFTVKDSGQSCEGNKLKIGIDIKSTVSWRAGNKNRQTVAQDQLFNWK